MNNLPYIIQSNFDKILDLCVEHQVEKMYLFGSVIREDFDEKTSDIDVIVEIINEDPLERGQQILDFWNKLEDLFDKKVDLLTNQPIRNPFLKKNIDNTKMLIYDRKNTEVLV